MRYRPAIRWGIALGLIACAGSLPSEALAQNTARKSQSKIIVYQQQSETEILVGVMGQVPKPGTYQFANAPTLQLAVDSAGGLTDNASPMLRVVRGQRVVQRVALHAAAKDLLQAGDLVIVDQQPQRGGQAAQSTETGVQLAFLGVVNRPVIVKVHAAQARADLVVQMLGQSPDLLRSLRVIPPPNQDTPPKANGSPRTLPALAESSVLLFDSRQIASAELRDLPEIIPCSLPEPDMGGYGVRNAYEERQFQEPPTLRSPGQTNPWNTSAEPGTLSQVPPPAMETLPENAPTLLPDHRIPANLSSSGSAGHTGAPVTTLPFSGTAAISARASRSTELPPELPPSPTAADVQSPKWNRLADAKSNGLRETSIDDLDAEYDEETTAAAGSLSIWHMLAIVASAVMLVGLALVIRSLPSFQKAATPAIGIARSQQTRQEQRTAEPAQAKIPTPHVPLQAFAGTAALITDHSRKSNSHQGERLELRQQRFSQLINRELALIEEPLALPPGLIFSSKDVGEIIRRDSTKSEVAAAGTPPAIRQIDPPHPQRIPAPHLRAAQESPVERALRQLQGGLS